MEILTEYMETLNDNDFKKHVISRTLCNVPNRVNGQQLLRILFPHSKRLPAEALMAAGDQNDPVGGVRRSPTQALSSLEDSSDK